jgi:hypothetical protein
MMDETRTIPRRTVGEWALRSERRYTNPFTDVRLNANFRGPDGLELSIPGFYDGENTWRVRFSPAHAGQWSYHISAYPANSDLERKGAFRVSDGGGRSFLRATSGEAWGFQNESGEPVFLLGDTTYNLFGMAHCGGKVGAFMARRAWQGFNLLRVRLPVSPFHPPEGYSHWQTRRTWPWGGSEQAPRFDRFNLDYFRTVDQVVRQAEELGLGLEMIMEAWGFEFPFNSRQIFVPEWEELWMRYLIARYDAFSCVYFWTLLNEYEYYPDGNWHYSPVADRWAMRVGRWVKSQAQHGHIVAVHNGPNQPPFAERFAADPAAIDAIMFQEWGTRDAETGWLAAGIEEEIMTSLEGWSGSAVFAEYGYERNPELPLAFPYHDHCDPEHTRRGAWRGAFCALGIIHGFENSWGPFMVLDQDQPGLVYLLHLRRFFHEVAPFHRLRPAPESIFSPDRDTGFGPLALASPERDIIAVYLPGGGPVDLAIEHGNGHSAQWYDPRTGTLTPATPSDQGDGLAFIAPSAGGSAEHPPDWVLVITTADGGPALSEA